MHGRDNRDALRALHNTELTALEKPEAALREHAYDCKLAVRPIHTLCSAHLK